MANNLQSKVAMALVSLSSVAAFFDGDAKLMASVVRMPMISNALCRQLKNKKRAWPCLCCGACQDERQDLSAPDEFQLFSLGLDQA